MIPFVSTLCPSDTYKVSKKGGSFRVDTTLVGFDKLKWQRGGISLIYNDKLQKLVMCDHSKKIVQTIWPREFKLSEENFKEEISVSLNTPIRGTAQVDWASFSLSRATSGYLWKVSDLIT